MTPFAAYCAPATARRQWWRVLLGLGLIVGLWVTGVFAVMTGWLIWQAQALGDLQAAIDLLPQLIEGEAPDLTVIRLGTFWGIWAGVALALVVVHQQDVRTILAPGTGRRPGGFVPGLILAALLVAISLPVSLFIATPVRSELAMNDWLIWAGPIALLVMIQAGGEELIFRGYLQQQLGARARHWAVWAVIPSLMFGAMHMTPEADWQINVAYFAVTAITGGTMAVLVWRTGALWTAIGLHVGVNCAGLLGIGVTGIQSGSQLYLFAEADKLSLFAVDIVFSVVLFVAILSPLGRVFGDGNRDLVSKGPH